MFHGIEGESMITVSVCMIVKNEEERLCACLDSLRDFADEIIIVDTGSADRTKEIAGRYTDRIYDFEWTGSFADARNFCFSKATCDYIYTADADETLDNENQDKLRALKEVMDEKVDIVQMYYCNQLENNTIYSFDRELRPKLYKRLRGFEFEGEIHEMVRLEPRVIELDIDIIHKPGPGHAARDLGAFERLAKRLTNPEVESESQAPEPMDFRLEHIYAKELVIAGEYENLEPGYNYFSAVAELEGLETERMAIAINMAAICAGRRGDSIGFMKYALRAAAGNLMTSELACELGAYYESMHDINEACMWYYNALNECEPAMDINYGAKVPAEAMERLGVDATIYLDRE